MNAMLLKTKRELELRRAARFLDDREIPCDILDDELVLSLGQGADRLEVTVAEKDVAFFAEARAECEELIYADRYAFALDLIRSHAPEMREAALGYIREMLYDEGLDEMAAEDKLVLEAEAALHDVLRPF